MMTLVGRDKNCTACELHKGVKNVCLWGEGTYKVPVFILGEAPGRTEDQLGSPFVGASGRLLRAELQKAGLSPNACYITNTVKCYPDGTPTPEQAKTCRDLYLRKEVKEREPAYILTVGRIAMEAVSAQRGIKDSAGKLYPCLFSKDTMVFPTFHPAYVLRQGGITSRTGQEWIEHLNIFATLISIDC